MTKLHDLEISKIIPGLNNTSRSVEVDFHIKSEKHSVYFRCDQEVLSGNFESYLAAALLPAMRAGSGEIYADGESSERLLSNISIIQNVYSTWNPAFQRVEIKEVRPIRREPTESNRVGVFFSGGVDSFYTLVKNQEVITDIIFVHGLDVKLENHSFRQKISESVHEIAAHFGMNLIEIKTNLRELLDPYIQFGHWGWSISLPVVGHLLFPYLKSIYISENYTYGNLPSGGSVLFPLWVTEVFELISDDEVMLRSEKISFFSSNDFVLQNLRVCQKKPVENLNCGKCEKCLRTMIDLKVNNVLKNCSTFENEFDIQSIKNLIITDKMVYTYYAQNLKALEENKGNEEIIAAIKRAINRPLWLNRVRRKVEKTQKYFRKKQSISF